MTEIIEFKELDIGQQDKFNNKNLIILTIVNISNYSNWQNKGVKFR